MERVGRSLKTPWNATIPQVKKRITVVRIAVARFELTPAIPIFANMDVSAANIADSRAKVSHCITLCYTYRTLLATTDRFSWTRSLKAINFV